MANIIYVGSVSSPLFTFTDDEIMSITNEMAVSVIGDELTADVFEFEVAYDDLDGTLRALPYATKVYYCQDETAIANFWFTNITRTGKTRYLLYCTSFVGLLEKQPFYGGMYFGKRLEDVVTQIIGYDGISEYIPYRGATFTSESGQNPPFYGVLTSADGKEPNVKTNARVVYSFTFFGVESGHTEVQQIAGRKYTTGSSGTPNIYIEYYNNKWYPSFRCRSSSNAYRVVSRIGDGSWYLESGTTFEVDVRPEVGELYYKYTHANGTTSGTIKQTFTAVSYEGEFTASTWGSFGSGTTLSYGSTYASYTLNKYQVYDDNGNLAIDNIVLMNQSTGKLYAQNRVTGYISEEIVGAVAYSSGLLDPIAATVMSSLSYGSNIENKSVYGWLPISTKREALYNLLFSSCANLIRSGTDSFVIDFLNNDVEAQISDNSVYDTGDVKYLETVKEIDLTIHSYDSYESSVEIFSNVGQIVPSEKYVVSFNNAPIYGTPVAGSGITIHSYNCNAAVVSGSGTITGTPYVHGKTIISSVLSDEYAGKIVSISDATLVSFLNYEDVLKRLKAYYQGAFEIDSDIIYNNEAEGDPTERTGRKYGFTDVFEEPRAGFLSKLVLNISAKTKAICRFTCNYVVPDSSGSFSHYEILSGDGTWQLPSGVTHFLAVLVGGGTGGSSGYSGGDGDQPTIDDERTTFGGQGGMYGLDGTPGNVFIVDITTPLSSYSYSCGTGGTGGVHAPRTDKETSNLGSSGTDTVFGSYSSASGFPYENGIFNRLTGERYAYMPKVWSDESGKGGNGGYAIYLGNHQWQRIAATSAYNVLAQPMYAIDSGGASGNSWGETGELHILAVGGGGGGGSPGDSSRYSEDKDGSQAYRSGGTTLVSGSGGDGMPLGSTLFQYKPPKQTNGCGGYGGVGGGGGGAAGCFNQEYRAQHTNYTFTLGTAGKGGEGGDGGDGGDGCVIIYY